MCTVLETAQAKPSKIGCQSNPLVESIFYFRHSILNTPCPPSPGARLFDLETIFTIGCSNSFSIRPSPGMVLAVQEASPLLQGCTRHGSD